MTITPAAYRDLCSNCGGPGGPGTVTLPDRRLECDPCAQEHRTTRTPTSEAPHA